MEGKLFREAHVKQVEAIAELDDGPDDGGAFDFTAFAASLLFCPLECSCGAVFPEVDAVAEPVVGVLAGEELGLSCEDGIRHAAVAAVVAEDCALV